MIRAGIVGLGWWGRNLVNAVAGGEAVRFVKAHTRNAETAAEFCRERSLLWVGDLDAILGDADLDVGAGSAGKRQGRGKRDAGYPVLIHAVLLPCV